MSYTLTPYEVLGIPEGATTAAIQRACQEKMALLTPERILSAPSLVVAAAERAQQLLDWAWRVLGDPGRRHGRHRDLLAPAAQWLAR